MANSVNPNNGSAPTGGTGQSSPPSVESTNFVLIMMDEISKILQEKYGSVAHSIGGAAGSLGQINSDLAAILNFITTIETQNMHDGHKDSGWGTTSMQNSATDFVNAVNNLFFSDPANKPGSDCVINFDGSTYYPIPNSNGVGYTWTKEDSPTDAKNAGYSATTPMSDIGAYEFNMTQAKLPSKGASGDAPANLNGIYDGSNDGLITDLTGIYTILSGVQDPDEKNVTFLDVIHGCAGVHGSGWDDPSNNNWAYDFEDTVGNLVNEWKKNPSSSTLTQWTSAVSSSQSAEQNGSTKLTSTLNALMKAIMQIIQNENAMVQSETSMTGAVTKNEKTG